MRAPFNWVGVLLWVFARFILYFFIVSRVLNVTLKPNGKIKLQWMSTQSNKQQEQFPWRFALNTQWMRRPKIVKEHWKRDSASLWLSGTVCGKPWILFAKRKEVSWMSFNFTIIISVSSLHLRLLRRRQSFRRHRKNNNKKADARRSQWK